MADDDQQAPQQRYWFPYWTSPPAPAPRPALRPQPSRRDTRPAQPQPPPAVTPSPSRRQPQATATAASRGAGGAGSPQAQPQLTRLSSRPSPSRGHPLSPIREPNTTAARAPASAPKDTKPSVIKPATPAQPAAQQEVPKELDIVVPQEKIIHEPPSHTKAHSKAVEKEMDDAKEKHKDKKDKEKEEGGKEKKKEKEKEHKEKKEKEKEHKEKKEEEEKEKEHKEKKDKGKHKEESDESKVLGGKLHKELKAGVADMVHKLGATAAPSAGHDRHKSGAGTTIITLAGENKGASMKVSHAEAESKDAAAKERRARNLDDAKHEAHGANGVTAFVNSNVQVVNNSLVLQSSCSSSDPGVHLKLSTKSKKKGDGEEAGGKGGAAAAAAAKKK